MSVKALLKDVTEVTDAEISRRLEPSEVRDALMALSTMMAATEDFQECDARGVAVILECLADRIS